MNICRSLPKIPLVFGLVLVLVASSGTMGHAAEGAVLWEADFSGLQPEAERYGLSTEVAEKQQNAIYENLLAHSVFNNRSELQINSTDQEGDAAKLARELAIMKEAGFVMKPVLSWGWSSPLGSKETSEEFRHRMALTAKTMKEALGHDDIYVTSWDEANLKRINLKRKMEPSKSWQCIEAQGIALQSAITHKVHLGAMGIRLKSDR